MNQIRVEKGDKFAFHKQRMGLRIPGTPWQDAVAVGPAPRGPNGGRCGRPADADLHPAPTPGTQLARRLEEALREAQGIADLEGAAVVLWKPGGRAKDVQVRPV